MKVEWGGKQGGGGEEGKGRSEERRQERRQEWREGEGKKEGREEEEDMEWFCMYANPLSTQKLDSILTQTTLRCALCKSHIPVLFLLEGGEVFLCSLQNDETIVHCLLLV